MNKTDIKFKEIPITGCERPQIYRIFIVTENRRSRVTNAFNTLTVDGKDRLKELIKRLATVPNFQNPNIKPLHGYGIFEVSPHPHRFFYFRKCGDNYIFFDYLLKKQDSFPDRIYRCVFRPKPATCSGESCHPFRFIVATYSGLMLPPGFKSTGLIWTFP